MLLNSPSDFATLLLLLLSFRDAVLSLAVASPPSDLPSPGCIAKGFELDETGHITRRLGDREYILFVPPEYQQGKDHPLVLSFHGAGGDAPFQEHLSQFSYPNLTIAGSPFLAAYPQGAERPYPQTQGRHGHAYGWQPAPYANQTVDDIQFIKDIVADISDNYCINQLRIYAAGKSNGGGLTNYLACRPDTSRIFAAFALASAALYPETLAFDGCLPSRPIPIITAHGTIDAVIHYKGQSDDGTGRPAGLSTPDVMTWRKQWAIRNGCPEDVQPNITTPYEHTVKSEWKCQADVVGYTVHGLAHAWPSKEGLDTKARYQASARASFDWTLQDVLGFFSANALPAMHLGFTSGNHGSAPWGMEAPRLD